MNKWAQWLIIGGLAVDLIDAFTTKAGASGGLFYGETGYLKGLKIVGNLRPGELVAMVGAGMLLLK